MNGKALKHEDTEPGEVPDPPALPPGRVAPVLANATPQERLAAILRRLKADEAPIRTPNVQRAVGHHHVGGGMGAPPPPAYPAPLPPPTGPGAGSLPTRPSAMHGYGGFGFPQGFAGGTTGPVGYGSPGSFPGPVHTGPEIVVQKGVLRGGKRPNINLPLGAVQQLSLACQARKFNPEVHAWNLWCPRLRALQCGTLTTARPQFRVIRCDKMYKCDIVVRGHLVQGQQFFEESHDAKLDTAAQALKVVHNWPLPRSPVPSTADITNQPSRGAKERQQMMTEEREESKNGGLSASPPTPSRASGVDMTNPLQARAFVEGYRMGQAVSGTNASSTSVQASDTKVVLKRQPKRSSSPHKADRRDKRGRRNRSPSPPRYYDGSRHDRSLPSTDKYRPARPDDKYRPVPAPVRRNEDKPKMENSYGRLKEEDYGG